MDPLTLGSITLLVVCLLFMAVLKLINTNTKSDHSQSGMGNRENSQSEESHLSALPWFNPEPRKDAIFAAGRYHWKMDIVYYSSDGSVKSATCAAPRTAGVQRKKITSMCLAAADGEEIPLHRIRNIEVQAASDETRRRYRVREAPPEGVLKAWRETVESVITAKGRLTILYQNDEGVVSSRTIQPLKLLSANSRPKIRAHCFLANAERHFLLERTLDLRVTRVDLPVDVIVEHDECIASQSVRLPDKADCKAENIESRQSVDEITPPRLSP